MRRAAVAVAASAVLLAASTRASAMDADEKESCITAAENGQELRDDQKYRLAHDAFSRCARETCPTVVRQDCTQWLEELEDKSPTVVIGAQDGDGHDLTEVTVSIDTFPLVSRLDGRPVNVDPGAHVIRYEAAGFAPVEESLVIAGGEKNRLVGARFASRVHTGAPPPPLAATAAPRPLAEPTADPAAHATVRAGPPLAGWVFAGVAVAAFASEAYFGLSAMSDRNADLDSGGCAPHCGKAEPDSIRTMSAIADASLGVGLVSAGLATYFFLAPRAAATKTIGALDFAPRPGGGVATVRGHF